MRHRWLAAMTRLSHLAIDRVRNLTDQSIEPCGGVNLLVGENGAGKTAVLEAVHILARGRSFRAAQASKVIQYDQEQLVVRADVVSVSALATRRLAIARPRRGPLVARVDGEDVRNIAAIARHLPIQVMLPSVSDLVFAGPRERRSWIDWGVFHVKHTHLDTARRYAAALRQRNARLKQLPEGQLNDATLDSFTESLIASAQELTEARAHYFQTVAHDLHAVLESLEPSLAPKIALQLRPNGSKAPDSLEVLLGQSRPRDVKLGITHFGPHRFDIDVTLAGRTASERLSRGQGKALALAMKLAQAKALKDKGGQRSLFLIDDAGAELDAAHKASFFQWLGRLDAQVLATSTDATHIQEAVDAQAFRLFHVEQGRISSRN